MMMARKDVHLAAQQLQMQHAFSSTKSAMRIRERAWPGSQEDLEIMIPTGSLTISVICPSMPSVEQTLSNFFFFFVFLGLYLGLWRFPG